MEKKLKTFKFKTDFYYETALDFCMHLGYNPYNIATITGYTAATIKRWLKNNNPPPWLLPFLYALAGGQLQRGFNDWRLIDGQVFAPGLRYPLTSSQVEAYTWHLSALHQALSRETATRPAQNSAVIINFTHRRLKK